MTLREKIRRHVEERLPVDARITWNQDLDGSPASVMNIDRPEFEQARQALSDEWGREAVFSGMGGSIPVTRFFTDILKLDSMLIGFAQEDDAIHSPNEKVQRAKLSQGHAFSWARVLDKLAQG
jgi:acetylornithine deacetylase/succinyl-diaminopimelate desuccinylase-like protein